MEGLRRRFLKKEGKRNKLRKPKLQLKLKKCYNE